MFFLSFVFSLSSFVSLGYTELLSKTDDKSNADSVGKENIKVEFAKRK